METLGRARHVPTASAVRDLAPRMLSPSANLSALFEELLFADHVHATREGNAHLAGLVVRVFEKELASDVVAPDSGLARGGGGGGGGSTRPACSWPCPRLAISATSGANNPSLQSQPLAAAASANAAEGTCALGRDMSKYVLESRGFRYTVERSRRGQPKPGYVASSPGAHIAFCFRPAVYTLLGYSNRSPPR